MRRSVLNLLVCAAGNSGRQLMRWVKQFTFTLFARMAMLRSNCDGTIYNMDFIHTNMFQHSYFFLLELLSLRAFSTLPACTCHYRYHYPVNLFHKTFSWAFFLIFLLFDSLFYLPLLFYITFYGSVTCNFAFVFSMI